MFPGPVANAQVKSKVDTNFDFIRKANIQIPLPGSLTPFREPPALHLQRKIYPLPRLFDPFPCLHVTTLLPFSLQKAMYPIYKRNGQKR